MAHPTARDAARAVAIDHGACLRPIQLRRTNTETGQVDQILVPCGATLASVCPPCAERAKNLRASQCREGWHLDTEPILPAPQPDDEQTMWIEHRAEAQADRDRAAQAGEDTAELDELIEDLDHEVTRCGLRATPTPAPRGPAVTGPPATTPRHPRPAPAEDQPAHRGQDLHRPRREGVPPVDVPHPDVSQLRQGRRGRHPGRPDSYDYLGPRGTRCTSPRCSTGSSRTCAASSAKTCSTSPPSNPKGAWPRTRTSPCAARSPAAELRQMIAGHVHQVGWPLTDQVRF